MSSCLRLVLPVLSLRSLARQVADELLHPSLQTCNMPPSCPFSSVLPGVTPKKGGTTHIGLPVFNSVKEAKEAGVLAHDEGRGMSAEREQP